MGTTYYAASAAQSDVAAKLSLAGPGDIVVVPDGEATWGAGSSFLTVSAYVTLTAQGDAANISVASDAPGDAGLLRINTGSVVAGLNFTGPEATGTGVVGVASGATSWRVTGLTWVANAQSRFVFANSPGYGLIDNCDVTSGSSSSELIYVIGASDAWQNPPTLGTQYAVYIEDCIFRGDGYVCDINRNGKGVVRNCTITGAMKIDAHGAASNEPSYRSARHLEAYRNHWTGSAGNWRMIEHRGGNSRLFFNTTKNRNSSGTWPVLRLTDYGYAGTTWGAWGGVVQTLLDYPILDQIGVGMDPKVAASEPNYLWGNRKGTNDANGYSEIFAQPTIPDPVAQSLTKYQDDMRVINDDPTGTYTFTGADIIQADRDYFTEVASFDGSSGVGIGTREAMDAITPSKTGVGFWVTDEGNWDTTLPENTSGRLYVWSGSAWVLDYTPYAYPHPLRTGIDPDPPGPTPYAFPVRRSGFGFGIGGIL